MTITAIKTKRCSVCRQELALSEFNKATVSGDRRQSQCRACSNASVKERMRRKRAEERAQPPAQPQTEWQCGTCGERWFRLTGQDGGQCPRCAEVFVFRTGRYTQPGLVTVIKYDEQPGLGDIGYFEQQFTLHLPARGSAS